MPSVLLLEKDPFFRRTYGARLHTHGFDVILSGDVEEASILAGKHIPDAVVCDAEIDGERAFEFIGALAKNKNTAHIPVLCMSNAWEDEVRQKAVTAGAKNFFIKSQVTPTEVAAHVHHLLT